MKLLWSIVLTIGIFCHVHAQKTSVLDVDFEFQAYPTGLIPGLRIEKGFADQHAVHLRLGYQIIDHRDLGVQEDETGSGYGLTLGYKRYFRPDFSGWFVGVRSDVWFNQIDWKNRIGMSDETSGTSDIVVIQPTAEAGYLFEFGNNWIFSPSLAFGWEVNVQTEGEDVGEGSIILVGLNFGKRF